MKIKNQNKRGFTLIELLVVVLIIGILASVALPQYNKAVKKSRASEAWSTLKSLEDALAVYQMETGNPAATPDISDLSLGFVDKNGNSVTGTSFEGKHGYRYEMTYTNPQHVQSVHNVSNEYYFLWLLNGKKYCLGYKKDCQALGLGKSGTGCLSSSTGDGCFTE